MNWSQTVADFIMTEVFIIYENRKPFLIKCHKKEIKDEIRYWMGKSPGMYRNEIEKIISVPFDQITDCTHILQELSEEEAAAEAKRREKIELAQYEYLKKKFEPES